MRAHTTLSTFGILFFATAVVTGFLAAGPAQDYFLGWLILGLSITIIFLLRIRQAAESTRLLRFHTRATYGRYLNNIMRKGARPSEDTARLTHKLNEHLVPRLDILGGLERVCEEAAATVAEAHSASENRYRYITFYGSASLSTVHAGGRRFGTRRASEEKDEDIQTPEQVYSGALEAAATDHVRIRRYIRLFSDEELRSRGRAVQEEYLVWLRSQYFQLRRNPNCRLTDVVRAPFWGSNVARIVTHRRLLELVGNGEAGLLLVGEDLSEAIRRHGRESTLGTRESRILPVHYGNADPVRDIPGEWRTVDMFDEVVLAHAKKVVEGAAVEMAH